MAFTLRKHDSAFDTPPIVVGVDATGKQFGDTREAAERHPVVVLGGGGDSTKERRIHVHGDRARNYGKVIEVMGQINTAGFTKVALVSEAPGAPKP